ncbi:RNA 2',3'-cyclic phosphodiesterase [Candidatus Woesearchaeota archaeon]|nr:RNA 2',3'-cyclic phosphodiesterase [Candidatus Woesearchaeota archaeon]
MRLFIGIDLPDNIKDCLFNLELSFKIKNLAKVNWVPKKNLHITLKFLGDVSSDTVERIKHNLSKVSYKKFKIKLNGFGFYPNNMRINVIWVGVEPYNKIVELQKLVDSETLEVGNVKLGAHITLGRVKAIKNKDLFLDFVKNVKLEPLEFQVNSFILYKSVLSKDSPSYEVLKRYSLV